ncbi:IS3 family transposase [Clostridium estertheticum]|uniref:IS3 family transposase n=1 Tax=Clostridium estertheticum TaxID=238834 RepID=A0AA47ENC4_9CLOT|nr:IS3 family transposase [Clostridium estertheticum]
MLSEVRYEDTYLAIQGLANENKFPITELCILGGVSHSAYYKWLHREKSNRELKNEKLLKLICGLYEENDGILGYRQMTIKIRREYNKTVNYKRIYRLMRIIGLKSVCRKKRYNYIKSTTEVTAENILARNFKAEQINEKWLTDVTEFKYGRSGQKAYLSAIFDLGDRSIVSYVIGNSNNNQLVYDTFNLAIKAYPYAKPIFHSDRGFQVRQEVA